MQSLVILGTLLLAMASGTTLTSHVVDSSIKSAHPPPKLPKARKHPPRVHAPSTNTKLHKDSSQGVSRSSTNNADIQPVIYEDGFQSHTPASLPSNPLKKLSFATREYLLDDDGDDDDVDDLAALEQEITRALIRLRQTKAPPNTTITRTYVIVEDLPNSF